MKGWVAEIVLALNETTDGSASIGREAGARVQVIPWQGFRDTKNAALGLASQPWALCLDADEEVSAALRADIQAFFARSDHGRFAGARFPRKVRTSTDGSPMATGIRTTACGWSAGTGLAGAVMPTCTKRSSARARRQR